MRKLSLQQYAGSPDGYTLEEGTEFYRWWESMPNDDELEEYFVATLRRAEIHIMGRVTYQSMAAYWPTSPELVAPVARLGVVDEYQLYVYPSRSDPAVPFSRESKALSHCAWCRTRLFPPVLSSWFMSDLDTPIIGRDQRPWRERQASAHSQSFTWRGRPFVRGGSRVGSL